MSEELYYIVLYSRNQCLKFCSASQIIVKLVWEPGTAQNTPAVYPHLVYFTVKLNFPFKFNPFNLDSQNQAKNISVAFPSVLSKFSPGVHDQSDKQRLQLYKHTRNSWRFAPFFLGF